ncbi:MAG: flavodoxin domain-containing protein [Acidimicrobiia bacterium]|nr:flavodoxin domain-containing protein [Acidimicrobiia bacterium]
MSTFLSPDRVLVAYGSPLGSTAEVAAFIGENLAEQGAAVDVLQIDHVGELGHYDRVVVGSAIRYDRWLPQATAFVESNRDTLSRVPVAMFFTCLALANGSAKGERKAAGYADQLRGLLPESSDVQVRGFAGVLDPSRGPLWIRVLLHMLSRVSGVAPGDYRDWDAIRAWALGASRRVAHTEQRLQ